MICVFHSAAHDFIALTAWKNITSIILQASCLEGPRSGRVGGRGWWAWGTKVNFVKMPSPFSIHLNNFSQCLNTTTFTCIISLCIWQQATRQAELAAFYPFGRWGSWDSEGKTAQEVTQLARGGTRCGAMAFHFLLVPSHPTTEAQALQGGSSTCPMERGSKVSPWLSYRITWTRCQAEIAKTIHHQLPGPQSESNIVELKEGCWS